MNGLGLMTVTHSAKAMHASHALACGTTVSRLLWCLPTWGGKPHTLYFFPITTQLAKGFKQNSPKWKSFRLLLWQNSRSTVIGRLGSSAHSVCMYLTRYIEWSSSNWIHTAIKLVYLKAQSHQRDARSAHRKKKNMASASLCVELLSEFGRS